MPSAQGHITVRRRARNGQNGTGVTITSKSVKYATSASGTVIPSSGWQTNVPSAANGVYIWTWTHVQYSDGNYTDAYSVSRIGIDGKGIKSSVTKYCQKANTNTAPQNFPESDWGDFPTSLTNDYWLYTRTIVTYSDNDTAVSYDVSQIGQGSYYAGCNEYYAVSNSKTTAPSGYPNAKQFVNGVATYVNGETVTIGSAWSTDRPTANTSNPYIWNFEISYDSRGNKYVTRPICIGNFARGIVSIVETYTISSHDDVDDMLADPTERGDYPWTDEQQDAVPNTQECYQWNKTVVSYNDGDPDTFYHISAVRGDDGVSVTGVEEQYARGTSNTTAPASGWKSNPASIILTATYKYLWNKERLVFSNGTYGSWTTPAVIGTYSKDGKSITGVTEYYLVTAANYTAPNTPPKTNGSHGTWTTNAGEAHVTSTYKYLWNYEKIHWSEGADTETDPVLIGVYGDTGGKGDKGDKGDDGDKGDKGDDGISRWLEPSVSEVRRYQTGDLSVTTISCAKKKQVGANAPVTAAECTMKYTYTNGGTDTTEDNYTGGNITIGLWWSKIVFKLYLNTNLNTPIATKTVLIIDTPTSVGANLLNGTNFVDEPDGGTTFASNKWLIANSVDGQKALGCVGTFNNSASIDFYKQRILNTNDIRVQAATWYTLSFWARAEGYVQETIGETSANYGFGLRTFYAEAGKTYTLYFNGYVDTQTVREGRELRVFIFNDDWSWNTSKATSSTSATTVSITFTVPTTGTYKIMSYVYARDDSGTGRATVNWYRLYRGRNLISYVYPSLIDTSAVQVIDGVISDSKPSDGSNTLLLTTSWVRHTFTFKTKSTLPTADNFVLFRLPVACNGARICMPKLERGVFATEWCRSERDKQGLTYHLVCKDSIQEGSTGCDIKVMMSYGEQSKLLTYAEATERGLAVTGTDVQWNSSNQRLYISGGASSSSTYTITLTLNGVSYDQKQVTVTARGVQGIAGCIQRCTEWVAGVEFHNDESLTSGTRYLDIVIETTGLNTFNAFKCKLTHTSTDESGSAPLRDSNGNLNTTHWQQLNNMLPIYTPMILAAYGMIRFAQTNQLLVMKADGTTVAAGMGGGNYPIWAGATTPEQAPFRVSIDGIMRAVGAELLGKVIAGTENGQRLELDPETKSLNIFDANGEVVSIFEGNSYSTISNLFSNESGSFSMNSNANKTISQTLGGLTKENTSSNTYSISSSVHTSTPTEITVSGKVYAKAFSKYQSPSGGTSGKLIVMSHASVRVQIVVCTYSDSQCLNLISQTTAAAIYASANAHATYDGGQDSTETKNETITGKVKVPAGYHVIKIYYYQSASCSGSYAQCAWGNVELTNYGATPSANYNSDFYVSRFFANGFVVGLSAQNYVCAYNGTNDGMHLIAENNNYGINVSSAGVKIKLGDSTWKTIKLTGQYLTVI